ncbi:MAG: 4Fe-4S dicluster domain-containing protein, partial [FCB group bacterium]
KFIFNSTAALFFLPITAYAQQKFLGKRPTTIHENKNTEVIPPGAKSIKHYTSKCTACNLCVSICCNQVLQPSFLEFGIAGIMQPRMDYHKGYCNYECNDCGKVCPTGAILPLEASQKKLIQLGKAKFIKKSCIVITEKTECGACSEHCPTKAVQMVLNEGLFLPEINEKICVGCGACEYACPTKPYKAIFVEGNPVHLIAESPIEKNNPIYNKHNFKTPLNETKKIKKIDSKMKNIKQQNSNKDFPF